MHNSNPFLPPVIWSSTSPEANEEIVAASNSAPDRKLTPATYLLNHLVVYRNPKFGWAAHPKSRDDLKQSWLPVVPNPARLNPSESEIESPLSVIDTAYRRYSLKSIASERAAKRDARTRLAHLRYALLVLALGGAALLLASIILHFLAV